ncbi:MAG TPA: hypothetical protein PKE55_06930, partial [Kiritimatiellia bacterium]|nr:hypothetical protein [Kiritimatiellia bacterium]
MSRNGRGCRFSFLNSNRIAPSPPSPGRNRGFSRFRRSLNCHHLYNLFRSHFGNLNLFRRFLNLGHLNRKLRRHHLYLRDL